MKIAMKKFILPLCALAILSACSSETKSHSGFSLTSPQVTNLDVQTVSLTDISSQLGNSSNLPTFKPSVTEAIREMAKDRLVAAGLSGDALLTIKEASISSQTLPVETGISSWFSRQQASKYVAHAEVELLLHKGNDSTLATAEATRWASLPEDPTDEEKKTVYFSVLNGLMHDLGKNLEASINEHMSGSVVAIPAVAPIGK